MLSRILSIVAVSMLACAATLGEWTWTWEETIRQAIPQKKYPPASIATIAMSDPGANAWPWPHLDYAILLRAVSKFAPRTIGIEVPFHQNDLFFPIYDRHLANVIQSLPTPVFAALALDQRGESHSPLDLPAIPFEGINRLPNFDHTLWPDSGLVQPPHHIGLLGILTRPSQRAARILLVHRIGSQIIPSWVLQIYGAYHQVDWTQSRIILGKNIQLRNADGKAVDSIPIDTDGAMRLRFARHATYPVLEFWNTLLASEQIINRQPPVYDLSVLRQKCVLIHRAHESMVDFIDTPMGKVPPGEIAARALENLFQRSYLRDVPLSWMLFLCCVCATLGMVIRPWSGITLLVGGIPILSLSAWMQGGWVSPFLTLSLTILISSFIRRVT